MVFSGVLNASVCCYLCKLIKAIVFKTSARLTNLNKNAIICPYLPFWYESSRSRSRSTSSLWYANHFFAFTSNSLQINDLEFNSFLHVQGSCKLLDPKFTIFFKDNSRENRLQLTFWANRPVAANPNPNPWYKTSLLKSISRTGTRETKDIQNFESQFPVCHVPVPILLFSAAVLYHGNG